MERALLSWIRVEARRHSELQMAWHREFHPRTRDHTAYDPDSEPEETPALQITQETVGTRLRTAAGGGGDPNDPDDDPRKRGSRRQNEKEDNKDEDRKGRKGNGDNPASSKGNNGGASGSGGGEPLRRLTGLVEGIENHDFLEDDADEDEITAYMREMFGVRPGTKEEEEEETTQSQPVWDIPIEERRDGSVDFYKVIDIITKNQKLKDHKVAGSTKDLTVPEFHGDLTKWDYFWATFTAVIDRHPKLSTINKFSKLRYYLKGVAHDTISHINFSEDNYHLAKRELISTFRLVDNLLNATSESYRKMNPCPDRDFKQYQKLVQKTNNYLRLLSIHHPRHLSDPGMLIKDIKNKLPPTIKDNWYRSFSLTSLPVHFRSPYWWRTFGLLLADEKPLLLNKKIYVLL